MEAGEVQASTPAEESVPIFGARKRAKELMVEVGRLREQLERLGVLSIAELEQMRDGLRQGATVLLPFWDEQADRSATPR